METKLEKVFENVLQTDIITQVFAGMISLTPEDHEKRIKMSLCHFQDLIKDLPGDDAYVKGYTSALVSYYHKQKRIRCINFMADVIRVCIKEMIIPSKPALECLLGSELLKPSERLHWCKTFAIVREFIHLNDYKGCRDILRMIFNKIKPISLKPWMNQRDQMNSVVELVEYILDPEACLLPGYLAVNEVRLYAGDDQMSGHWVLSNRVAEFVDRFRAIATMVSITGRGDLLPIFNHFSPPMTTMTWRIDPETLRFQSVMKIQLPYDRSCYQSQSNLLRYVLAQPYSREMVFHVLGIQKQLKARFKQLEAELVELIIATMEMSNEQDNFDETDDYYPMNMLQWQHLGSHMIFFALLNSVSFPKMVESLHQKLAQRNITKGREHLLWILLQYVSGCIQKNPLSDFLPTVKLVHLLYPEKVPLPEPDITKPLSMHQYAAICILVHLNKKYQSELQQKQDQSSGTSGSNLSSLKGYQHCHIPIPVSLQAHYEYLHGCLEQPNVNNDGYTSSLICNACSNSTDIFNGPLVQVINGINGDVSDTITMPGENCVAFGKTVPLSMSLLNSFTVHTKMSIIQLMLKVLDTAQSQNRNNVIALSPAFVETYSRLLVYMEAENHGIKVLLGQVFPKVLQNNSLSILNMLLELCTYRLHHIQPQYRIQLLTALHKLASNPSMDHNQLQVSVESTALRMITALLNVDVKAQLTRVTTANDPKQIISKHSEEFNRVLVLTIARSLRITGVIPGTWCTDILKAIMETTPHTWGAHTLKYFPRSLQEFYLNVNIKVTDKETLKSNVELEYRDWSNIIGRDPNRPVEKSMEQEAVSHFTRDNAPPLFLCLLWKVLASRLELAPVCYTIVTALGRQRLSSHVRLLADFLVHEFSLDGGSHAKRFIPIVLDLILKYNLVSLDQLILCLALRCNEGDEARVALFIIQYLLLQPEEFRGRVLYFVQEAKSADHWAVDDWHLKHMNYHNKFPEKFFFEGLKNAVSDGDINVPSGDKSQRYLPVYFGNLPLRLLPVFDIVIHRSLELMQMPATTSPEPLLMHLGPLYKFHPQPITYLFNTLHYYEKRLRDMHKLKKVLVTAIIGSLNDSKPSNWALSARYLEYSRRQVVKWEPGNDYYCHLVKRVVDTMLDKRPTPFPPHDWRFNEFPNASAYALNVTCVELMALPVSPDIVGMALMDVVLKTQSIIDRKEIMSWVNVIALILTTLPEVYWKALNVLIMNVMDSPALTSSAQEMTSYPFYLMKFSDQHYSFSDQPCTRLLALTHAMWHQMGLGHLSLVPQFLKEHLMPKVTTELQLLYVCHLIAPFLPRFQQERTRCMLDVVAVLYDMLQQVSSTSKEIRFMDEIADFLYHIKYIHVGDAIKDQVEKIIEGLQPALRKRLRFIYSTTAKPHFQVGSVARDTN